MSLSYLNIAGTYVQHACEGKQTLAARLQGVGHTHIHTLITQCQPGGGGGSEQPDGAPGWVSGTRSPEVQTRGRSPSTRHCQHGVHCITMYVEGDVACYLYSARIV